MKTNMIKLICDLCKKEFECAPCEEPEELPIICQECPWIYDNAQYLREKIKE